MNCKYENFGEIGLLTVNGELSAQCSNDLAKTLMISISNTEYLFIDMTDVTVLDPSCLKLFSVAFKTAQQLKKKVIISRSEVLNCTNKVVKLLED